jgi:hypothetical protein
VGAGRVYRVAAYCLNDVQGSTLYLETSPVTAQRPHAMKVSSDPSVALRSGAIEELLYMLHEDRQRAIALFETTMEGHPELSCSQPVPIFVHYGAYKHFALMKPLIEVMMRSEDQECQQRGAVLV